MSKAREEAYKKGPLLIKIEPCPKTGKAEPCTEECTKECLEKSYTIFDPKPPRKKRKSVESPPVTPVQVIEPARTSIESSSSSNVDSVKTENSSHVLKSPTPSLARSSDHSHVSFHTPIVIPLLPDIEEDKTPIRESETSIEMNKSPTKGSETSNEGSENSSRKSGTSIERSESPTKMSGILVRESETSEEQSETSIKRSESSVRAIRTSIKEDEIAAKGIRTSIVEDETPFKESESSIPESETSIKRSESSVRAIRTSIKENDTPFTKGEAPMQESETYIEGKGTSIEGSEAFLKGSEISFEGSETAMRESEPSIEGSEAFISESEPLMEESETSMEEIEPFQGKRRESIKESVSFGVVKIFSESGQLSGKEDMKSELSMFEELSPSKEPLASVPEEEQNGGCVLEVLILEKHDRKCKSWKPPDVDGTVDWLKGYNIISHHSVPICQGHPSPHLYIPQPMKPYQCICEKSTNVNKFASCPLCSLCPCHGRQIRAGVVATTESEPLPPSEPLSASDLSEPDTFIESVSSKSIRYDYVPDFRSMPIVRQPQEKKYPFFVKCFVKNKKKPEEKVDTEKGKTSNVASRCPQCPQPLCLDDSELQKSDK